MHQGQVGGSARAAIEALAMTLVLVLVITFALWLARDRSGRADPDDAVLARSEPGCGATQFKNDGTTWQCSFADDFEGDILDTDRWVEKSYYPGATGALPGCVLGSDDNIEVADGVLRLSVAAVDEPSTCGGVPVTHTGASIATEGTFSQEYGRFEARMRSDDTRTPGLLEGFWLRPEAPTQDAVGWAAEGEIDVAVTASAAPDVATPYLHYTPWDNDGAVPGLNTADDCAANRGDWHDYLLIWSPAAIRIYVDGDLCLVNESRDAAFDQPYVLSLTVGALASSAPDATSEIDWVRVWR